MRVVISESRVLTALHEVELIEDLFALGHHFHVSDIFLDQQQMDGSLELRLLSLGMIVDEMSPSEMVQAVGIRRANPGLCVGNSASLSLASARRYPLLVGNHGLATLPLAANIELLDICWIMDELETIVPVERLHECLQRIIEKDRKNLHSPGVANRLHRYRNAHQASRS